MKSIIVSNLHKTVGSKELFHGAGFRINPGEKYGLIGPNGCGKTTLLNILGGQDRDFTGEIRGASGITIGYVRQNICYSPHLTVKQAVLTAYDKVINDLRQAEKEMAAAGPDDMEKALARYQQARDAYDTEKVDEVIHRLQGLLDALGIPVDREQRLSTLSGGEKNLLAIACAVIKDPDLLILDEPDNHLDFAGLAWFERFMQGYPKTIIIVSHKRYLLDRICSVILEIEKQKVTSFKGNYSAYKIEKLKNRASQQADYAAASRRLERLENLVKRFQDIARRTADPAWGKRLRARKTQLRREREAAVGNPLSHSGRIRIDFNAQDSKAAVALRLKEYSRAFGERRLFENAELEILCGEKVGIIGTNGSGKTTLLKDIVRHGDWNNPLIQIGPSLKIGYMAQQQEMFDPKNSIVDEIRSLGRLSRDDAFRLISRFLFSWRDMEKKIRELSGGEINRLQLARLIHLQPSFLILDEPTNHLDIPSREVVEDAVCDFKGTVLVVSHDRYFLEKTVGRIVEVKERALVPHNGSFSEFWLANYGRRPEGRGRMPAKKAAVKPRPQHTAARISELEKQITDAEAKKTALETEISGAFGRGDHREGRKLSAKLEFLGRHIEKLYAEWEELE